MVIPGPKNASDERRSGGAKERLAKSKEARSKKRCQDPSFVLDFDPSNESSSKLAIGAIRFFANR
jgi:hypothetical protein